MKQSSCELSRSLPLGAAIALKALALADDAVQRLEVDPWLFALTWPLLHHSLGIPVSDIHWLLNHDLLLHRQEIPPPAGKSRRFRKSTRKSFTANSCFVLNQAALSVVQELIAASATQLSAYKHARSQLIMESHLATDNSATAASLGRSGNRQAGHRPVSKKKRPAKPTWDADCHKLRLGEITIKVFKKAAANQELILSVFEEEGWPEWIDDPLPPRRGINRGRRLNEAVKRLNRSQITNLIQFSVNTVEGRIYWKCK